MVKVGFGLVRWLRTHAGELLLSCYFKQKMKSNWSSAVAV
jgi:hypothetical protein